MNVIGSIKLCDFKQKQNKDTAWDDCDAIRKIYNQALIGSKYNGLMYQNTRNR